MTDILDEVLNDEKDEKRLILFRRIFPTIIIITLFIAILMTGYSWYNAKLIERNKEQGDILIDLVSTDVGKESVIISSLEQIGTSSENRQAELALIERIYYAMDKKDFLTALKLLENIINNKKYTEITTAYARLLWIGIILDLDVITDAQKLQAQNYCEHFSKEGQLFYANATILKSLYYKKIGRIEEAINYANSVLKIANLSILHKEQALAILASIKNNK